MFVAGLAKFFSSWSTLYGDSKAVSTAVASTHILALLVGGGLAVAADRNTLRALERPLSERVSHLLELRAVHRPVMVALGVLFLSGLAMAAADVQTFATSIYFWVKMAMVALLMANGLYLLRAEQRLTRAAEGGDTLAVEPGLWRHLRRASVFSLTLWVLTALAGAVLVGAA